MEGGGEVQEEEEGEERQGGREEEDSHGLFTRNDTCMDVARSAQDAGEGKGTGWGGGAGGIALVIEHNARVRQCQFKLQPGMDLEVNADKQADREEGDKER